MKEGDLVIHHGTWGVIQHIYHEHNDAINLPCLIKQRNGITSTGWLQNLKEAKIIEVNSGVFLDQEEMDSILNASEDFKIILLDQFAKFRKVQAPRILGFGLMENGEIIYTQVVEVESSD